MNRLYSYLGIIILLCCPLIKSNAQGGVSYELAYENLFFNRPVELVNAGDGSNRFFVVEQEGYIKVFDATQPDLDSLEVKTFLDINDRIRVLGGGEQGLLGLAFHPNYKENGYFYVYYTKDSPLPNIKVRMALSRFQVSSENSDSAVASSEQYIFEFDKNLDEGNHNGGKITFGSDGYLYVSIGDGGGAGDPQRNGQDTSTIFGSILRLDIDVDGSNPIETNPALPNGNYEVPSDNPYANGPGLDELYAIGIRNTWKMSFDQEGRLWGGDVGQRDYEEINLIENGGNYGWSRYEAIFDENADEVLISTDSKPIAYYNHDDGDRSITGGYVYYGSDITSTSPSVFGKYIFADYVSGRVWALNPSDSSFVELFRTSGDFISSFGVDEFDELYFTSFSGSDSQIYKLINDTGVDDKVTVNGVGQWSKMDGGLDSTVNALAITSDDKVVCVGEFDLREKNGISGPNKINIGLWDDTNGWQVIGGGSDGRILTVAVDKFDNIYIGGEFTTVAGVAAKNIAKWDGSNWSAFGSGVDGEVAAIAISDDGNTVYAGGVFSKIGVIQTNNIAKWDGSSWSALVDASSSVSGLTNEVRALTIGSDGTLFVGGNFASAGGKVVKRIATWDGSEWGTIENGTSGFVQAIIPDGDDVFLGGNFAIAGNDQIVKRITKWDNSANVWQKFDGGLGGNVNAMVYEGEYLYVAGAFEILFKGDSSIIVNNLARWSQAKGWEALGRNDRVGVNNIVNSIALSSDGQTLFAGGTFTISGIKNLTYVGKWESGVVTNADESLISGIESFVYPNPTKTTVQWKEESDWELMNVRGEIILKGSGRSIDLSTYSEGLYYIQRHGYVTVKVIKE